ncbi:SDR family NAD(P)-dependent oxidoreductase [Nocardia terpenica]|uniref:type I polyketide synthase n=1 Tax=Nocardia terpenica TaxID=455432 RepID=UPI0018939931|nr:type I polyketide synthase [Nocardia terpenica]MBF6063743.1 SDR family NAD(P)-dependent oxidoreductase [Nocardia terpenica]MBF6107119.1 SDR family NAD(P)-dependent oxidoreductase [Nocardia terpenica]MBF6114292.1 SDR family NAD(P)-dependent oxidoreductase [Nocardia terpenica]MBF6121621.1 SDR family NAD(P)-dependent oxidoreductase [Nocardia terpenica]MBF6154036.1 SDR family NAD(P)-dependent oxidoreductase [Nocardia terpenica]
MSNESATGAKAVDEQKYLEYLKRLTADLRSTREALSAIREREHEPIAIVGMACRYPGGVRSPEQLWELVDDGVDAISTFPADRGWPIADPSAAQGGFLHDAGEFDAGFFSMGPREALATDPQQRLMLEVAWESLERAGIVPAALRASDSGVFIGAAASGYGVGVTAAPEGIEGHLLAGGATSVISGRIAYHLGWEGPVATVDTACSSSLVAMHLAVQALRRGECSLALAGGVAVMATPAMFAQFSAQQGLAADGRVKAFSDSADGTVWSEGAGVLLLERLSDAQRNGRRILGLVRGTAINSDGASNGLTAPNGPSQQRVIRAALTDAGLTPAEVDAVDAHGTGTSLGDPIEAQALLATYGQDRNGTGPLLLGALKSNIGHTQSAAGVGGVIKMLLAMRHGRLPRTLHVNTPSTKVDWSEGAVELLTEPTAWPVADRPRRSAVSSFGISGTNAHVVLEQAPEPVAETRTAATVSEDVGAWLISARSAESLAGQAAALAEYTERSAATAAEIAAALVATRSTYEHRAVVLGADRDELVDGTRALAASRPHPDVVTGTVLRGRTAFLFPGQGSQHAGMGARLAAASPVAAAAFDEIFAAFDRVITDGSLREVMFAPADSESARLLDDTRWTQPALFAVEVATFRLWESWGVTPQLLIGHSVGALAAAHVAGVLSLEDAATLVATRARVMSELPAGGAMAAIASSEEEVRATIGSDERVDIATINGPSAVVVSGVAEAVDALVARYSERGVRCTRLRVSHAFHSALMEPALAELRTVAAGLTFRPARIPIISDQTGRPADTAELTDPNYWVDHIRKPVRFADAIATARARSVTRFLEVGPGRALSTSARTVADGDGKPLAVMPGFRSGRDEYRELLTAAAQLHVAGVTPSWPTLLGTAAAPDIDLPTYAFDRTRFWLTPTFDAPAATTGTSAGWERSFWEQVEREDVDALVGQLGDQDGAALAAVVPALAQWHRDRRIADELARLRLRVTWSVCPVPTSPTPAGTWIVLGANDSDPALAALRATGLDLRITADDDFATVLSTENAAGVVAVPPAGRDAAAQVAALTAWLRTLATHAEGRTATPRLWVLTRGAVSTSRRDPAPDPAGAAVWGAGRALALERSDLWGGLIDLPADEADDRTLGRLRGILAGATGEDQVALRAAGALARRIERAPEASDHTDWTPRGTVLITGGTGALGAHVARLAARRGAAHLVLLGRRGAQAPGANELAAELRALGAEVTLAAADAADRDALAAVLARIDAGPHPLTAVVHAAGVGDDTPLAAADDAAVRAVLDGKALGAEHLDALTADRDLDQFVLFSSISAAWGAAGQCAYAAANARLDALAERRIRSGKRATSVAWGPWRGSGMAADPAADAHLRRRGLNPMDPVVALVALERALSAAAPVGIVADVDWQRFLPAFTVVRPAPLFDAFAAALDTPAPDTGSRTAATGSELVEHIAAAGAAQAPTVVLDVVRAVTAGVLGHAGGDAVDPDRTFGDLGVDSVAALALRDGLVAPAGRPLPATAVFDHPTPRALAHWLLDELVGAAAGPAVPAATTTAAVDDDPIVIVGLGCRFPGGVDGPDSFWELLAGGRDVIGPLPDDRGWDPNLVAQAPGGGFLSDAGGFDAAFFGISPREALAMDPQQRVLLEVVWSALEHAGIDPVSLRDSRTGVFIGSNGQEYATALAFSGEDVGGHVTTGTAASVLSGRISYTLGLSGPSVTVDTACSASLVALHQAVHAVRAGECERALAGGVTVMAGPGAFAEFSRLGALSVDGRCRAFADGEGGTGWGEGCGVVVVERLSAARARGGRVLAVVRGSAINSDGASNGLTAPNGVAQQRVLRAALEVAGVRADDIDAIEAHGTGTALGDPIEASALQQVFGGGSRRDPLWLGSVKSNIGHTQAAAGIAGVIKMVLALSRGWLPATLHANVPSRHVNWDSSVLELVQEGRRWPEREGGARFAGVSAFGMSGTNAHMVLQAPEPVAESDRTDEPAGAADPVLISPIVPWIFSARTRSALTRIAEGLIPVAESGADLSGVARALLRRSTFGYRAMLPVDSGHHGVCAAARLQAFTAAQGAGPVDGIMSGVAESSSPRTVFVFSGQGGHWAGMGAGLWDTSPVFRARLSECADALAEVCDLDVVEVLRSGRELDGDAVVQPVTWAVMVALAAMWRAAGVTPYAVVGHSQGEVAAAVVAGALSVADGARVVAARSRLVGALAGSGGMVSFGWSEAEVREHLAELEGGDALTVAALNGPAATVVAGPDEPLGRLMAVAERAGIRNRRVAVDYPSHSPAMDALRPQLLAALDGIAPADRTVDGIRWWSTARGGWLDPAQAGADYWFDNLRQPVRFRPAIEALLADGCRVLIEAGPHPTLRPAIWEIAESLDLPETGPGAVTAIATLRRDADWPYQLLCVFARAWMSGVDIDWSRIHIPAETRSETPDLPTYPFEHTRFWPAPPALAAPTSVDAAWAAPLWAGIDRADVDALATELAVAPDAPFAEVVPALAAWRDRRREGSMIDGWRYHIAWHPLPDPAPAHLTGTWLRATAAGAPGAVADEVTRVLRAAGATVVDLEVAADLGHRSVAASRLRALAAEHGEFAGVIGLTGLLTGVDDAFDALHPTTPRGLTATLHLVQALGDAGVTAPLWLVTRGGVSIGPSDRLSAAEPALIWGFGRVAATEHPDRVAGLIDLPASVHDGFDDRAARRFVGVLARAGALGAEDQLALRDSGILARRFVRLRRPAAESPVQPWRPRGTVLVTGGTGAIGGHLARWLARGGAEHLVLVSRRGPQAAGAAELTAELEALGARVTVVACDVGDPAAVADLLAEIDAGPSPLRAVMHAAGALDDGLVQDLDADRFEVGLRPKAGGAVVLDLATRGRDLDAFVLFSSTSGVLGGTGLGNYAPGNAFLDALALLRRDAGERATAIAWGHWGGEGGMARGEVGARLQRYGVVDMAPETALQALQVVLDHDETSLVVAAFDWQHFAPAFVGARPAPLLAELPDAQQVLAATRGGTAERADRPALVALLADVPPKDRPAEIGKVVRSYVAAILGHSGPEAIVPGTAFRDLGIDSLTAVELRNALGKAVGMRLPATLVFDYPTPAALTEFIIEHVAGSVDGPSTARPAAPATTAVGADPVVIVGMSCRFPGGVRTPEDLWELLVDGRDAMRPFPTDRGWDLEALYSPDPDRPGTSYARDGGFLVGAAEFDAEFFGISPREALAMDPQQRILLEVSWEALERAGIDPSALRGSATGVFAGTNGQDYAGLLVASGEDVGGYIGTGNAAAVLSGRVAYALGLEGPAVTVDTACSASLVALHQAAAALRSGECDLALAGGATVMATPGLFQEFSRQRGLSADGRCKAFADAADGTGFSEGAAVLVLARQSDAVAAGYPILAVVRGSAINSDGASNGLTAPNGPSQQRVIRSALAMSGLTPAEVDMVEAHGTGTTLGDPIEAQAVLATYGQDREQPLWLGSIKSNVGHTQAAAGVAGVMKSVLALQHGRIPATLHVDAPSSHVDWSAGAVELVTETVDWPQADRPRRAGVSSFGISGTNAHVIIEQAPEPAVTIAEDTVAEALPVLPLILSGRTPAARAAQAGALAELCAGTDPRLPALASALGRRTAFDHRAVVLASDRDGAHAGLGLASNGDQGPNVVAGSVISGSTGVVFAGQGSQHAGMGRDLYAAFDAYADAFDQVCVEFDRWLDRPLRDVVFGSEPGLVDRTGFTQPALFAFEVALYRLLESWGLRADVVLGHSIGEIVAAHVAGVLTLADAVRLVAARAGLMEALPEGGVMVAVACAEEVVAPLLAGHEDTVGIAAVNGPHSVVLSGLGETVDSIVEILRDKGIRTRRLTVSHAFHSPLVEPMLAEFERVVAELEFAEPRIALVSALTGAEVGRAELSDPRWWVRHVREAVRFADAVEAAAAAGATRFVELAPRAVLRPSLEQVLADAVVVSTGTRAETGTDAVESVVTAVARLWVSGGEVNPVACLGDVTPGATELFEHLPTYPFQHRHYWPVLDHAALARRTDPRSATDEFWRLITTGEPDDIARALGIDTAALAPVLPALAAYDERRRDTSATDGLRLRVAWRKLPEPAPAALRGRWLVACAPDTVPHNDFQQTLIDALDRAGADIVRLTAEDRGDARAAWSEALRPVLGEPIAGVVSLLAAADPEPEQPVPAGYSATIALVQALTDARVTAPVWAVTVDAGAAPDQAMAASFLRVAGLEHPELRGGIVDLPDRAPNRQLTQLFAAAVAGRTGEDEIRLRDGAAFGRRLVTVPAAPAATESGRFAADGTVLVTGGTGAIGGHLARWCAANGAAHLVLVGARGPQAPGATELAAELTDLGATVDIVAADAADRTAMRAVLDGLPADRPLRAVIHAAAVLDDATITAITPEQVARALRVKVGGARLLDELTADADLEAFVLVSSLAGVLGALGQGNYAPGNAALDALAQARTRRGLPGSAIAFGSWAGGGMVDGELDARLRAAGMRALEPARATAAFGAHLAVGRRLGTGGPAYEIVADFDWTRFTPAHLAGRPDSRLLAEIPAAREFLGAAKEADTPAGGLAALLSELPAHEHALTVDALVRRHVAAVLGHDGAEAIDPVVTFGSLGVESLAAVEIRNVLSGVTGLALPPTLVYDYPTPAAVTDYLLGLVQPEEPARPAPVRTPRPGGGDPVAVVGIGCRFPGGADTPERFWDLLLHGTDAVGDWPDRRQWDLLIDPADTITTRGAFLDEIDGFDPAFFGISPREALAMDPQQRLLLEICWEATERAGIDPSTLRGSRTGVFVGTNSQDYASRPMELRNGAEAQLGTGTSASVLSGRISYVLGAEGPSMTVDTACSSSLVALHLAARELRSGDCDLVLAGGVTVMSTPGLFAEFTRQGGLAADGRCKAFADEADGTGWGEGAGILVLERLSDARAAGHPVLAVLSGTAVNSDGTSNGLTAPNGLSQERVIRSALEAADLAAEDVDLIEAHGTGTTLGDPIEARALLNTYGSAHRDRPLWLGSVKSNIGHTQAAAGVAGVIKAILALRHETVPATLHAETPTRHVDWTTGGIELVQAPVAWPANGRPRHAGVSAFGLSGTNAHVIIGDAPEDDRPVPEAETPRPMRTPIPWVLSARTPAALADLAQRVAEHTDGTDIDPMAVARTLATGRAAFEERAVALGSDTAALSTALRTVGDENAPATTTLVRGRARRGRTAVVFTGQGGQRPGIGAELATAFPVFAAAVEEVVAALRAAGGDEVADAVTVAITAPAGPGDAAWLDRTELAQPTLFALSTALFRLLESWGVDIDVVTGHSVGEIVAAHVAGVLTLDAAARFVVARGRAMAALPEAGGMLSITAGEDVVSTLLDDLDAELRDRVSVAAVNGPAAVVVAGGDDALAALAERAADRGLRTRPLRVSHAFHSPLMRPCLDELAAAAETAARDASVAVRSVVSTLTGGPVGHGELADPAHWVEHARRPVRFADAVAALREQGVTRFLEVGPDAGLAGVIAQGVADEEPEARPVAVPLLRRDTPEPVAALAALAALYADGGQLDWARLLDDGTARAVLPTYPFQRRSYWLRADATPVTAAVLGDMRHPLVPITLHDPTGGVTLAGRLSLRAHRWLTEHTIGGTPIVPGAAFVDLAIRAGDETDAPCVEELLLDVPLPLDTGDLDVRVMVAPATEDGRRALTVHARPADDPDAAWTRHARGRLGEPGETVAAPGDWPPTDADPIEGTPPQWYADAEAAGFAYGPVFRGLRRVWTAAGEHGTDVFAEVALPDDAHPPADAFALHPALLDAATHALVVAGSRLTTDGVLPFLWAGVTLHLEGARALRVWFRAGANPDEFAVVATDTEGTPVFEATALRLRPAADRSHTEDAAPQGIRDDGLVLAVPRTVPLDAEVPAIAGRRWAVVGDDPFDVAATLDAVNVHLEVYSDPHVLAQACEFGAVAPPVLFTGIAGADPESGSAPAELAPRRCAEILDLVRALVAEPALADSRLAVLLRGARPDGELADPVSAAVAGFVRTLAAEHPGRLVLVHVDSDVPQADSLAAAVTSGHGEVVLRDGATHLPAWQRRTVPPTPGTHLLREPGTVLVTGATGGLGTVMVRHLVAECGVRRLVLASRGGTEVTDLADAEVTAVACDVTDRAALAALVDGIADLRAVVHIAGVIDDATAATMRPEQIDRVFAPKAAAAWALHELTADRDLDAFVLFSSAAGPLGSAGQANYAAANAFLDALAAHRRGLGLPGTAIAWGSWAPIEVTGRETRGMTARATGSDRARVAGYGMRPILAAEGARLFDAALAAPAAAVLALAVTNRSRSVIDGPATGFEELVGGGKARPTRRRAAASGTEATKAAPAAGSALPTDPAARRQALAGLVIARVAEVLGHDDTAEVTGDMSFVELGIDSLTAVELRNRLEAATGLRLPPTIVFDVAGPGDLADYLADRLDQAGSATADTDRAAAEVVAAPEETLAGLFRVAVEQGKMDEGFALLQAAAELRPTFTGPADLERRPVPIRLVSQGRNPTPIFAFSSYVALAGVHQYARLASIFRGDRTFWALPAPGFGTGEPLPASLDAVARLQAEDVLARCGDTPPILLGSSSGGTLAQATADELTRRGVRPAAIVLIDTYHPKVDSPFARFAAEMIGGMFDREETFARMTVDRLSAMSWYLRTIGEWEPPTGPEPILLLRAGDPPVDLRAEDGTPLPKAEWQTSYERADLVLDVPGNHFTMMETHARSTAAAIRDWLATVLAEDGPEDKKD